MPPVHFVPRQLNSETVDIALDETSVSLSENFLYEDGTCRTRPPLASKNSGFPVPDPGEKYEWAKAFVTNPNNHNAYVITSNNRIGISPSASFAAGPAITFDEIQFRNADSVNGVILIGGTTFNSGLIRLDPSAGTYTQMTQAPYRYVAGHFSRAVAAVGGAGFDSFRTFAWSKVNDETIWTGDATAGTAILSDTPDDITGLAVHRNIVLILRRTGISLAYPQGTATGGAFRIETFSRFGYGCVLPSSVATYGNETYYVGSHNVYRVTAGQQPQEIGTEVRKIIAAGASGGIVYQGFITRGIDFAPTSTFNVTSIPKRRYHLVPIPSSTGTPTTSNPSFSYDINENKWAIHTYPVLFNSGYENWASFDPVPQGWSVGLLEDVAPNPTNNILTWADQNPGTGQSDNDATLRSGVLTIDSALKDYVVTRAVVVWQIDAEYSADPNQPLRLKLTSKDTYGNQNQEETVEPYKRVTGNFTEWFSTAFDIKIRGNFFVIELTVPHALRLKIDRVILEVEDGRGQATKANNAG